MKFSSQKPNDTGIFLYREGDEVVTVKVDWYKDLQSGISNHLVASPTPPRWNNLPRPCWDVDNLHGMWYTLDSENHNE